MGENLLDGKNAAEKTSVETTTQIDKSVDGDDKKAQKDEVVFVHEVGFNVKMCVPGVEPFDIQVSSMELVQEIHQLLMDREDTCHRTCFSLQLNGTPLDNFAELKSVEGLKEGSVIKVVEEPYTVREARIHVRHVRDLLKSLECNDAYNGVECASLSFLNIVTHGDLTDKKKVRPESVDCTPPDHIIPGSRDRPILPLHPVANEQKPPQCLKVLTTSAWNPPPGPRRLHGDLLYLYVVTMEDKRYHVTASTKGFFVNQSTDEVFSPQPSAPNHLCHSLIDLICHFSAGFRRHFVSLQKRRTARHPFERVATPYQVFSWTSPALEHTIDAIRAEDAFSSKLGYEEHIPGQTRDWNEELQTTRDLPRKTLPERLLRERAIFKVHSDFVAAAWRGAVAVVDGNVMAINPGEDSKMQMFIWNNIFFSLGFDVRDHYKELGGDAAAFVAPRNDLHGVKVYSMADCEGLYTLGTVVIDYRGYRVTAQSIIPGILEREQEQSVVYGSIDFGKTVVSNTKYMDLLSKPAQQLKIAPHRVVNEKGEIVELCSSVECKGIVGNDGRHYILDLLRTFPPDVNFLCLQPDQVTMSSEARALGFPIRHKHSLACLRQELVDAFVESRYMAFIKNAARQLQLLSDKKSKSLPSPDQTTGNDTSSDDSTGLQQETIKSGGDGRSLETTEAKKMVESITDSMTSEKGDLEESTREIVRRAAAAVGSLKECEFEIRFNPDVFSPGVRHPDEDTELLQRQRTLVREASDFLLTVQIPGLVRDCLDHSAAPVDGTALVEALHSRGINVRYLGKVAAALAEVPQLSYLLQVAVSELVARAVKHIFTSYMQGVEMMFLSAAVAHFLNCYLSSNPQQPSPLRTGQVPAHTVKRKNKRRSRRPLTAGGSTDWCSLTSRSLWQQISKQLLEYFDWQMDADSVDSAVCRHDLQKISMFRSFCIKTGVQVLLRDYNMDQKHRPAFFEQDIVNIFPVTKHINPRATDAFNFYTTGQTKIQQGFLKEGHELISEALNLLNSVYGAMHPEIAQCLRMLARLNYIMGDHQEALQFQQKAVLMSERANGIDHPYTITEYMHLALYCFANGQVSTALRLLYRSRYLLLLICGENHPEMALLDSNIGLILHAVSEYSLSLHFLEHALQLNQRFFGERNLKTAVSHHLVARTQSCMGDFRAALQNEKETFAIYKFQLGEDHEKTKESSACLRHLTQQAVMLQKKMNELYRGKSAGHLPPIQIQSPSMGSVLDMLNVINGILFVQISPQDIENFKAEMERRTTVKNKSVSAARGQASDAATDGQNEISHSHPIQCASAKRLSPSLACTSADDSGLEADGSSSPPLIPCPGRVSPPVSSPDGNA